MTRFRTFLETPSRSNAFARAKDLARALEQQTNLSEVGFHVVPLCVWNAFVVPNEIYARVQIEHDATRVRLSRARKSAGTTGRPLSLSRLMIRLDIQMAMRYSNSGTIAGG